MAAAVNWMPSWAFATMDLLKQVANQMDGPDKCTAVTYRIDALRKVTSATPVMATYYYYFRPCLLSLSHPPP